MVQRDSQNQQSVALAANLGLARPPAIYLIAILSGLVLHFAWPMRFVPNLVRPFGGLIAILAVTLFIWSIKTFRSAGTPVPGSRPTTAIPGWGLGLAFVKRIAEQHGGRVEAKSDSTSGTCFRIILPVKSVMTGEVVA